MLKKLFDRVRSYVRKVPVKGRVPKVFGVQGKKTREGAWHWQLGPWEVTTVGDRVSVRSEPSCVCLKRSTDEAEAYILEQVSRHTEAIGYKAVPK